MPTSGCVRGPSTEALLLRCRLLPCRTVDLAMDDDSLDESLLAEPGDPCSRNMSFISEGTPGKQANAAGRTSSRCWCGPIGFATADRHLRKKGLGATSLGHRPVAGANIAVIAAIDWGSSTRQTPRWRRGPHVSGHPVSAQTAGGHDQIGSLARGPRHRDMIFERVAQRRVGGVQIPRSESSLLRYGCRVERLAADKFSCRLK